MTKTRSNLRSLMSAIVALLRARLDAGCQRRCVRYGRFEVHLRQIVMRVRLVRNAWRYALRRRLGGRSGRRRRQQTSAAERGKAVARIRGIDANRGGKRRRQQGKLDVA